MKICRFDDDRIGVVRAGLVHDVSAIIDRLAAVRYPFPPGDASASTNTTVCAGALLANAPSARKKRVDATIALLYCTGNADTVATIFDAFTSIVVSILV